MRNETKYTPKYPATMTVHCPSGPTNACDLHAQAVRGLMAFMGAHVVATTLLEPAECDNCMNDAKSRGEAPHA